MEIDTSKPGNRKYRAAKDQPVCGYHKKIDIERPQLIAHRLVAKRLRLQNRQPEFDRQILDRRRDQSMSASGRSIWLRDNCSHVKPRIRRERLQRRHGIRQSTKEIESNGFMRVCRIMQ